MKRILFIICMLLPLFGWGQEVKKSEDLSKATVLKKGDLCPAFIFKDTRGEEVSLKQFKGKYVVIDVWASWCYPCKQEFPNLKKLEEKYKDKNIVFVSISCDQSGRRWQDELGFLRDKLTNQWWIAGDDNFMKAFQIAAIPRLILLDQKGRVINLSLPKPSDPKFEKILNKLKEGDSKQFVREGEFTLTVTMAEVDSRNKLFLFYRGINDRVRIDSATSVNGKFVLKGSVAYPQQALIRVMPGNQQQPEAFENGVDYKEGPVYVFLEKGKIDVSAGNILHGAKLGGTPLNNDLQAYNDSVRFFRDWLDGYREKFGKAYRDRNSEVLGELSKEYAMQQEKRRQAERNYFDSHRGSLVSLDWLARSHNIAREKSKILPLFESLEKRVKKSVPGKMYEELLRATLSVEPGNLAPDFTAENVIGEKITLSSLRGQYVLLDFWASWCGPCRRENVNVLKVYDRFKENGFTVVGYSLDSSVKSWQNAVKQDALPWTQLSGLGTTRVDVAKLYGVSAIPSNFLIDPEGIILAVDLRGEKLEKALERVSGLNNEQ